MSHAERVVELCRLFYDGSTDLADRAEVTQELYALFNGDEGLEVAERLFAYSGALGPVEQSQLQYLAWKCVEQQIRNNWDKLSAGRRKVLIDACSAFLLSNETPPAEMYWREHAAEAIAYELRVIDFVKKVVETIDAFLEPCGPAESGAESEANFLVVCSAVLRFLELLASRSPDFPQNKGPIVEKAALLIGTRITHDAAGLIAAIAKKRKGFDVYACNIVLCENLRTAMDTLKLLVISNPMPYAEAYDRLKVSVPILTTIAHTATEGLDPKSRELRWLMDYAVSLVNFQSLTLRRIGLEIIANLSAGQSIRDAPFFMECVSNLAEMAVDYMTEDVLCSHEPPTIATKFSQEDFTEDSEVQQELLKCRNHFFTFVEIAARHDLERMTKVVQTRFIDRLDEGDTVLETECEFWGKTLKTFYNLTNGKSQKNRKEQPDVPVEKLEALISDWPKKVLAKMRDLLQRERWALANDLSTLGHALLPLLGRPERIAELFEYLDNVKTILWAELELEDPIIKEQQLEFKRHTLAGLVSFLEKNVLVEKTVQVRQKLLEIYDAVRERLTSMQTAVMSQVLAYAIDFPFERPEEKLVMMEKTCESICAYFASSSPAWTGPEAIVSALGFEQPCAVDDEVDVVVVEQRRTLRATLNTMDGVLKVVKNLEPELEAHFRKLFEAPIASTSAFAALLFRATIENGFLPPSLLVELRKPCAEHAATALSMPIDDLDDVFADNKDTWEGMCKKFHNDLHESIISAMIAAIRRFPDSFSSMAPYLRQIDWAAVPDFRLKSWIRRFWKEAVQKCQHIPEFWELFGELCAMFIRIQIKGQPEVTGLDPAEAVFHEREFVSLLKEWVTTIRYFILDAQGIPIARDANTGSQDLRLIFQNLLLGLSIRETGAAGKAAQGVLAILELLQKSYSDLIAQLDFLPILALLMVGLARYHRESPIGTVLVDCVLSTIRIMKDNPIAFDSIARLVLRDDKRGPELMAKLESYQGPNWEKPARLAVKQLIIEMLAGNDADWLQREYEKSGIFKRGDQGLFSIWI
ncbi:unnamed protein product, partial [Mesorhabditis spiculigera]